MRDIYVGCAQVVGIRVQDISTRIFQTKAVRRENHHSEHDSGHAWRCCDVFVVADKCNGLSFTLKYWRSHSYVGMDAFHQMVGLNSQRVQRQQPGPYGAVNYLPNISR
jgi:hypothetical protein